MTDESQDDVPFQPKTADDAIARFQREYGSLDFLSLDPQLVTAALADYMEALGICADTDDAYGILSDEDKPILPAEFLSAFSDITVKGEDPTVEMAREIAALLADEELFEPYLVAPVPLVTLIISILSSGTRVAYMNDRPEIASALIDAAHELSVSLAVQTPRFDSGVLSRRNAEFQQVPGVFTVFNENEYTIVTTALMLLDTMLTAGLDLKLPPDYDTQANAESVQQLLAEFENFVLPEDDDEDLQEETLSDEEVANFLSGTFEAPAADEEDEGAGFGVHPIDTSAHVIGSTTSSDPTLLSTIPDEVDEVPVVVLQVEGHPAVETAWDMMVAAKRVGHSGGIAPEFIENNPAHPTVLLHVWADIEDVDTGPESPHHPPCIIVPLCLSCHAEACSLIEDTGWLILTPQDSQGGIAISLHSDMFMKMELEAFRIASNALMD